MALLVRLASLSRLALLSALLLASSTAHADEAAARTFFKKGIELYDRKQYADALIAFQDAYREKPSAGIKQNIALSLKGLNRPAEAATSLDEALDEGKDTLKPETRTAIERELAEISKSIATVNVTTVAGEDRKPVANVVLTIQPEAPGSKLQAVSADALRRPIRLMPGIYTFSAHASGYPDPPQKRLALVSGAPTDIMFVMGATPSAGAPVALGPNEGYLKIATNVPDAVIRIDGVDLPERGNFAGKVAAGSHKIEISAPGKKTTTMDVNVAAGATLDQPVKLLAIGEAPPEYVAPGAKAEKPKNIYLAFTGAIDTASYRFGMPLGEAPRYGSRRSTLGLSVGGRLGYKVGKNVALEALLEAGGLKAQYKLQPTDQRESEMTVNHWQLMPMVRASGSGKVRFTMATGFGVNGLGIEAKLAQVGSTKTKKGNGVGFIWMADLGMQADVGPVFLELALFLNVHNTSAVQDDEAPQAKLLYASPATRGGLRLGLGVPF